MLLGVSVGSVAVVVLFGCMLSIIRFLWHGSLCWIVTVGASLIMARF